MCDTMCDTMHDTYRQTKDLIRKRKFLQNLMPLLCFQYVLKGRMAASGPEDIQLPNHDLGFYLKLGNLAEIKL